MELRNPIGLSLLLGIPALIWLFRRKRKIGAAMLVSTNRWFTPIAPKQFPLWRWWLWPLLLACCAWFALGSWTWVQPQQELSVVTTDVWDAGLNMPEAKHTITIGSKADLFQFLTNHSGKVRLHTNLQISAWGQSTNLPSKVSIVREPLPQSVGISGAGFVGSKLWVQFHNHSGQPWSGDVVIKDNSGQVWRKPQQLAKAGDMGLFDLPLSSRTAHISIDGQDAWKWDDTYLVKRPSNQAAFTCDTNNLFVLTWAQLVQGSKEPRLLLTDRVQWPEWDRLTGQGGTVVWFANQQCRETLAKLGITLSSLSPTSERGEVVAADWAHLGGLRQVSFTSWGNTAGWDAAYWGATSGRTFIGAKKYKEGTVVVVMGPLSMPETELPALPIFIPLMAELVGAAQPVSQAQLLREPGPGPYIKNDTVFNFDRALIQPMRGDAVISDQLPNPSQLPPWELFGWLTVATFFLLGLYTWRRKL